MAKKKARRTQNIPENESNAARFVRVVSPRVAKAVKAINQIGLCAGKMYEYTPEQVKQITGALAGAILDVEGKFKKTPQAEAGFTFKK